MPDNLQENDESLSVSTETVDKVDMLYIPITKVDEERREVWGWGAKEMGDMSQEIMDYQSSKPHFEAWTNQAQKRSGGKSQGNVREMHQPLAAGKLIDFHADDVNKGFYVGARIVDDAAWKKVTEGVYTGFSIGGSYVRRWPDSQQPGLMRYTAKPIEMSIVDSPCIPDAVFQVVKMASVVPVKFAPGLSGERIQVVWEEDEVIKVNAPQAAPFSLSDSAAVPAEPMMESAARPAAPAGEQDPSVQAQPNPFEPLEITPNAEPSQEELRRAANLFEQDLTDEVRTMLGRIPEVIKAVIAAEVPRVMESYFKRTPTSAPARMIPVVNTSRKEQ